MSLIESRIEQKKSNLARGPMMEYIYAVNARLVLQSTNLTEEDQKTLNFFLSYVGNVGMDAEAYFAKIDSIAAKI